MLPHSLRSLPLSLKYKIIMIVLLVTIVPIILASLNWHYQMVRSSLIHSSAVSSQFTRFAANEVSGFIQDLSQSLDPVLIDSSFQRYLKIPKDDIVSQAGSILSFRPKLETLLQSRPEIEGIVYYDKEGKVLYNSNQKSMDYTYDFKTDAFFRQVKFVHKPALSPLHPTHYTLGASQESISLIRPVTYLISGDIAAWLIVDIKAAHFKQLLNGAYEAGEGQILLYHPASGKVVSNQPLYGELEAKLDLALQQGAKPGEDTLIQADGDYYEVIAQDFAPAGWQMVLVTPFDAITQGVKESRLWTLLIAFLSIVAACSIAFPMIFGLRRVEHQLYDAKMKEKEKELLLLQAQMNPHFLFNTLETIDSFAMKHDGAAIRGMVQHMARMMRYNARLDNGWTSLREEMKFVVHFLNIHRYRNGTEVECQWKVAPELLDAPVPKLIIQPFIENALKYGWSPAMKPEEFALNVHIFRKERQLAFHIENTGMTIQESSLAKIKALLCGEASNDDPFFQHHTGIYNIYYRLLLTYGNVIEMDISARSGGGTTVEFRLPFPDSLPGSD